MSESRQILGHRFLSKLASLLGLRVGAGKVDPVNEKLRRKWGDLPRVVPNHRMLLPKDLYCGTCQNWLASGFSAQSKKPTTVLLPYRAIRGFHLGMMEDRFTKR